MRTSECLSVCPRAYISNHARDFCACCLWPWLSPSPAGWCNHKGKGQFWVTSYPIDNALYCPYSGINLAILVQYRHVTDGRKYDDNIPR